MSISPIAAVGDRDDRFRWMMDASIIGMAIVDRDGHWRKVNPAFERLFGYRADELAGKPVSTLAHPDDGSMWGGMLVGLLDGDAPAIDAEQRYLHRDGSVVWAHVNVGVMRDAQGVAQSLLVQLRDITAVRAAEAVLQASASKHDATLEASQRQLQLFADAVAHDLRAPLRSIESFSGLLATRAADRLDDTDRDYLQRIRVAANNMSGLLVALSELSGVTRAEMKPTHVDLGLLAEWVGAELQEADPDRRAEIVVQPGLRGWGDERLLKQLLGQLLGNAWKFSRERDVTRIEVGGRRDGGTLRLTVRDGGIGFDSRYAHKLFEPFQRLHGPGQGGGHGLGLAIAQRIAERHGGHISAESQPDGGATFVVELPAAEVAEDRPDA
ncbi:MAG: sensor histidine kinase [Lysobacter sp.]